MISLPYVKTRLTALLEARTELDGVKILGRMVDVESDWDAGAGWEAFAKFGDATEAGIDGDLTKTESCGNLGSGWQEEYDLPLLFQVSTVGDADHTDLERVRSKASAACMAVCIEPTLGRVANPDPDGYVTDLWVRPVGWSGTASGVQRTEGYDDGAVTVGGFEFAVTAWLTVS